MMTGLRAHDTRRPTGKQSLVEWLKPDLSHRRRLKALMDSQMEGQYSSKASFEAAKLTLRCLEPEPRKRPSMEEVVVELERIAAMSTSHRPPRSHHAGTGGR